MRSVILFTLTIALTATHNGAAQSIPATVKAAEAEGAAFPRRAVPAAVASAFAQPFGGTAERRCVAVPPTPKDRLSHPLRSGDFIVNSAFGGPEGPHARQGLKIAWVPLHSPVAARSPLVVRAARIGHSADSLRIRVRRWVSNGHGSTIEGGIISVVRFPTPGTWMAVATAGVDWGCFLVTVDSAPR
jgi:hypothetical protein